MTIEEQHDLVLLALAESAIRSIAGRCVPNSHRHNRLKALQTAVSRVDATYRGTVSQELLAEAEKALEEVEDVFARLYEKVDLT